MAKTLRGVGMVGGNRQISVVVLRSLREIRYGQCCKRAGAVGRVVFLLGNAGVVKAEVGEVRRHVAGSAVPRMLRSIDRAVRGMQEDFQALQFERAESEGLRVILEAAVGAVDENGIGECVDGLLEFPVVLLIGFSGARLARQMVDAQKYVVRRGIVVPELVLLEKQVHTCTAQSAAKYRRRSARPSRW